VVFYVYVRINGYTSLLKSKTLAIYINIPVHTLHILHIPLQLSRAFTRVSRRHQNKILTFILRKHINSLFCHSFTRFT